MNAYKDTFHTLTHSLTLSLTHSVTHTHTHSLTLSHTCCGLLGPILPHQLVRKQLLHVCRELLHLAGGGLGAELEHRRDFCLGFLCPPLRLAAGCRSSKKNRTHREVVIHTHRQTLLLHLCVLQSGVHIGPLQRVLGSVAQAVAFQLELGVVRRGPVESDGGRVFGKKGGRRELQGGCGQHLLAETEVEEEQHHAPSTSDKAVVWMVVSVSVYMWAPWVS